jgi:hypothetical protein
MPIALTEPEVQTFHRDGYVIKKRFFDKQEIKKLYQVAIGDAVVKGIALVKETGWGKEVKTI